MKSSSQEPIRSLGSPSTEDWWNSEAGHEHLILEDPTVRAVFDAKTGAWIDFQYKPTGWKIQKRAELGQSFRAYAAWKDRLFNPVSGLSCRLRRATIDAVIAANQFGMGSIAHLRRSRIGCQPLHPSPP